MTAELHDRVVHLRKFIHSGIEMKPSLKFEIGTLCDHVMARLPIEKCGLIFDDGRECACYYNYDLLSDRCNRLDTELAKLYGALYESHNFSWGICFLCTGVRESDLYDFNDFDDFDDFDSDEEHIENLEKV